MLRKLQQIREEKEEGFTIIEVLIVLAIAALILVIVLVAIPQLQRNQRNTARRAAVARISQEIGNFIGNNNGVPPENATALAGFSTRYLTNVNVEEPTTGDPIGVNFVATPTSLPVSPAPAAATDLGTAFYSLEVICDGEGLADGSERNYALWTIQEGGAIICFDNR